MQLGPGPRAVLVTAVVCGLTSCAKEEVDLEAISKFERQMRMPPKAGPLIDYERFYAPPRRLSAGDLPFTTLKDHIPGLELGRSRVLATAIYVRGAEPTIAKHPKAKLVNEADLPRLREGGCDVVNIIYDPASLRTVDAWCNSDFFDRWTGVLQPVP